MSVWFAAPYAGIPDSVGKVNDATKKWMDRGYKTAILRLPDEEPVAVDLIVRDAYRGYAASMNALCKAILELHPDAEWIISGDLDILPSDQPVEQIARECNDHFHGTLGIMECTGDRYLEDAHGRASADRHCISPWMGREFVQRVNGGRGPLCEEYFHYYVDRELKEVSERLGLLWQRRDIIQFHDHWNRKGEERPDYLKRVLPTVEKSKAIYQKREKRPGSPAIS